MTPDEREEFIRWCEAEQYKLIDAVAWYDQEMARLRDSGESLPCVECGAPTHPEVDKYDCGCQLCEDCWREEKHGH